eukprot:1984012-Rhodomonas_salina.1
MSMRDFLGAIDWYSVELTNEERMISLISSSVPPLHPPFQAQHSTDSENFGASVQLANDLIDIVGDCPAVSENSILLAAFGLDPELPWWRVGIGKGFPEGHADPEPTDDDIALEYTDTMAKQVHLALLRISPESRELERLLNDDLHANGDEEIIPD